MTELMDIRRPSPGLIEWTGQNRNELKENIVLFRRLADPDQRLETLKEIVSCPAILASAWFEVVRATERLGAPPEIQSEAAEAAYSFNREINRTESSDSDREAVGALMDDLYADRSPEGMKRVIDQAVQTGSLRPEIGQRMVDVSKSTTTGPPVHTEFSGRGCGFCAAAGSAGGLGAIIILCIVCGIALD